MIRKFRGVSIREDTYQLIKKMLQEHNENLENYYYPKSIPKFIEFIARAYRASLRSSN